MLPAFRLLRVEEPVAPVRFEFRHVSHLHVGCGFGQPAYLGRI